MSELRVFLPYAVRIVKRPDLAPVRSGRTLEWGIIVCDREYNLLFTSWLLRKPTNEQVAAFAVDLHEWTEDGVQVWLYDDATAPTKSRPDHWRVYCGRLQALSRLEVLYRKYWNSESSEDYEAALASWRR